MNFLVGLRRVHATISNHVSQNVLIKNKWTTSKRTSEPSRVPRLHSPALYSSHITKLPLPLLIN